MISLSSLGLNYRRSRLALIGLFFGFALSAHAQVVTWFWVASGVGTTDNYTDTANWSGGVVPPNDGTARLQLPLATGPEVMVLPNGALALDSLYLELNSYYGTYYRFKSAGATILSLAAGIGSPNNGYSRSVAFDATVSIDLTADQTWTTSYAEVNGAIGGVGKLTFSPHYYYSSSYLNDGTVALNGPGNFTGGLSVHNTHLTLGHAHALDGSGTVSLSNVRVDTPLNLDLSRALTVSGTISHYRWDANGGRITFSGPITLAGATTFEHLDYSGSPGFTLMLISGNIAESTEAPGAALSLNGGTIVLSGINTYTGATYANGSVIFATLQSVAPGTTIYSSGYAGTAFTQGVQPGFIARLDRTGFSGTIGFDTLAGPTQTFAESIDLTGVGGYFGLGSTSSAVLSGTINVGAESDYRFGNGGGRLVVTSALTDGSGSRSAIFRTSGYLLPTTVVLQGNNTFTGDVQVLGGAVIFDGANALPGGATVAMNTGDSSLNFAYAGITQAAGLTPNQFIGRLDLGAPQSVVGLDSTDPAAPRTISETIDLSLGQHEGLVRKDPYFLGTATKVILTGPITTGGGSTPLQLTGFKGGELIVTSVLGPVIPSVVIGLSGSSGVVGLSGTVRLDGANTYEGGTTFQSGILTLGHNAALGTGALTTNGSYVDKQLLFTDGLTLANAIQGSSDLNLGATGSAASLTLTGGIFTSLNYLGSGTLTYSGTNPHLGSLTTVAGAAPSVVFSREGAEAEYVQLGSGNLAINADTGIELLRASAGTTLAIAAGKALTLEDNSFGEGPVTHELAGVITGAGALRLEDNSVALTGANTFAGGLELDQGNVGFTRADALGTGAIRVQGSSVGGLWVLAPDFTVANAISLGDDAYLRVGGGSSFGYNNYATPGNRDLTLTGVISGNGGLLKDSGNTVTLTGRNSFRGDIGIQGGALIFTTAESVGSATNRLIFGYNYYQTGTHVSFLAGNPVVGGISDTNYYSEGAPTSIIALADGMVFTIGAHNDGDTGNQYYRGAITGNASLVKDGLATQTLGGANTYTGGTTIKQGTLIAGNNQAFGTGSITIDGGRLGADYEVAFTNPIIFGANGGVLGGNGTFTQPITIGPGVGLAPGFSPGTMSFTDLTLEGGGFLEFEIQDPSGSAGAGFDTLQVSGLLTVNATPGNPYIIHLRSLDINGLHGALEYGTIGTTYTLTLATSGTLTGFDPNSFQIDASAFSSTYATQAQFFITSSGNDIVLNFTPVPEPSTYALLALGVGLLWFVRRRR